VPFGQQPAAVPDPFGSDLALAARLGTRAVTGGIARLRERIHLSFLSKATAPAGLACALRAAGL